MIYIPQLDKWEKYPTNTAYIRTHEFVRIRKIIFKKMNKIRVCYGISFKISFFFNFI